MIENIDPESLKLALAVGGYLWGLGQNLVPELVGARVDALRLDQHLIRAFRRRPVNHDIQWALRESWTKACGQLLSTYHASAEYRGLKPDDRELVNRSIEWLIAPETANRLFPPADEPDALLTAHDVARLFRADRDEVNQALLDGLTRLYLWDDLPLRLRSAIRPLQESLRDQLLDGLTFHFVEIAVKGSSPTRDAIFFEQLITLEQLAEMSATDLVTLRAEIRAGFERVEGYQRWEQVLTKLEKIDATTTRIDANVGKLLGESFLRPYDEVMSVARDGYDELVDWPILGNLGREAARLLFIDEGALHAIDRSLTEASNRRVVLAAGGGRGKTVLSRLLAHRKYERGWEVYFVDVREVESQRLEVLANSIERVAAQVSEGLLIVVENAHLSDEVADRLVALADRLARSPDHRHCHFLFNTRDFVRDPDLDPFGRWKEAGLCHPVNPGEEVIYGIIGNFLRARGQSYALSELDRRWVRTHIFPNDADRREQGGGDLRLLRLYLMAWSEVRGALHELSDADILASLKRFLLVNELSREEPLADLLGRVSTVFQFDVPFFSRRSSYSDSRAYINDLEELRKRGRIKYLGREFYTLAHSIDAYYVSRCLASHHQESHEDYTARMVGEYITELPSSPLNTVVDNLLKLFRSLYGEEPGSFASAVFKSIYSERQRAIEMLVAEYALGVGTPGTRYYEGLGLTVRVLDLIDLHVGRDEANAFWERVSHRISQEQWSVVLRTNKPFYIDLLMRLLPRIAHNEDMASRYLYEIIRDFNAIFKTSNLHKLNEMFKHLPDPVVFQIMSKVDPEDFAEKILESKPIYLEFALDRLEEDFLRAVLRYIREYRIREFLDFLRQDTVYRKNLLGRIRRIDAELEETIRLELKPRLEHLRNREEGRRRTGEGRMVLTNKIANNYSHGLNDNDFRNHLVSNFEDGFISTINNITVMKRLMETIVRGTKGFPQQERGRRIIGDLVYQMTEDLLRQACSDRPLMELIRGTSSDAFAYLCRRCDELF